MPTRSITYTQAQNDRLVNDLWPRLIRLCEHAPQNIYRATWSQFDRDTGGWTINSLAHWVTSGEVQVKVLNYGEAYEVRLTPRMEIEWSLKDGTHIVTVPDLPGCTTHGDTLPEAIQHGNEAIASWLAAHFDTNAKTTER